MPFAELTTCSIDFGGFIDALRIDQRGPLRKGPGEASSRTMDAALSMQRRERSGGPGVGAWSVVFLVGMISWQM